MDYNILQWKWYKNYMIAHMQLLKLSYHSMYFPNNIVIVIEAS